MAFRSMANSVGATAVRIYEAVAGDVDISVSSSGPSGTFWLGGDDTVSSANGFVRPVATGQVLQLRVRPGDELWAVSPNGGITVCVLARSA